MKNLQLHCFKNKPQRGSRSERRLSLGEYRKAVSWSKYLVSSGAEIKGEGEEEWSADMSQLLIGTKFASGRHSRIYHGIYKEKEVAIKMISQPEEDPTLAVLLEQQFISEVSLLFRLRHPNIIANARPPLPATCPPALSHLISQCWATNPEKRPQFEDIVEILENYKNCFRNDPAFFLSYKPVQPQALLRCFPRCITLR
ncbi:Serine/threonine-protein kinase HT1, partial [Ananas comosus]